MTAEKTIEEVTKDHEARIAEIAERHSKEIAQFHTKIANMTSAGSVHEAEKSALAQSLNELLQNNIRLRAGTILLDSQGKEGFGLRDKKIQELTITLEAKNAEIAKLTESLRVAHEVIAASTNLVPPAKQQGAKKA